MPSLFILIPIFGIIILNLPLGGLLKKCAFWYAFALFSLQIILAIFHNPFFWSGELESISKFFNVSFTIDHLGFLMLLSIGIVCLSSLVVSRYVITDEDERFNFINLLIIASIGLCGVVMVKDIFSMYVFLEVTAVASFILIAFDRGRHALEGAFKYIVLSSVASIMMLSSIALFILIAGDTSFSSIAAALKAGTPGIQTRNFGIRF
ncbi:MAG: proton-conducting transporter membrane subunit [Candidatus Omnitrophica bacterium]|nr:proton-conducting transporter membrane subunit [Candidatus Omnitrophota bacterium]